MRKLIIISICGLLVLTSGCSFFSNDTSETENQYISLVYKSPDSKFTYQTYAITDSVLYVNGDKNERTSNSLTEKVVDLVASQMDACNYKRITDKSVKPDIIVDLSFIITTTTAIYPGYWWDWDWWYWYDWYYPIYPYYPYPMYPIASSYSSGSLVIEIVDVNQALTEDNKNVPIVWHGLVRGIIGVDHSDGDMKDAIEKCFTLIPPK